MVQRRSRIIVSSKAQLKLHQFVQAENKIRTITGDQVKKQNSTVESGKKIQGIQIDFITELRRQVFDNYIIMYDYAKNINRANLIWKECIRFYEQSEIRIRSFQEKFDESLIYAYMVYIE